MLEPRSSEWVTGAEAPIAATDLLRVPQLPDIRRVDCRVGELVGGRTAVRPRRSSSRLILPSVMPRTRRSIFPPPVGEPAGGVYAPAPGQNPKVPAGVPASQGPARSRRSALTGARGAICPGEDPRVPAFPSRRVRPIVPPEVHDRLASSSEPLPSVSGVEPDNTVPARARVARVMGANDVESSDGSARRCSRRRPPRRRDPHSSSRVSKLALLRLRRSSRPWRLPLSGPSGVFQPVTLVGFGCRPGNPPGSPTWR